MLNFTRKRIDTRCTVTVLHTDETLEAHVELDDGLQPQAGDHVRVLGAPIRVPYGEEIVLTRRAQLRRGSLFDKGLTRVKAMFELTELYEVSFSEGTL
ncbi:MAG: hypothetical protein AAGC56_02795 [Pseudomonadota bacterium]